MYILITMLHMTLFVFSAVIKIHIHTFIQFHVYSTTNEASTQKHTELQASCTSSPSIPINITSTSIQKSISGEPST